MTAPPSLSQPSRAHEQFLEDTKQAAIDSLLGGGGVRGARERRSTATDGIQPVTVFVGTWNVNGKVCSVDDLIAWLGEPAAQLARGDGEAAEAAASPPDAYVVGFQEFVDLNAKNLVSDDLTRRKECRTKVDACLEQLHGEKIDVRVRVGVRIAHVEACREGARRGGCHARIDPWCRHLSGRPPAAACGCHPAGATSSPREQSLSLSTSQP